MKTFSSKILLFGEYSVLQGTKALAIPFPMFSGELSMQSNMEGNKQSLNSNKILSTLHNHLINEKLIAFFNEENYREDLNEGLYFKSNIPAGYGLGSSGALAAAIYDKYYVHKPSNLKELKMDLAKIESFFHGNSSGTDPLVSYTNKSLLLNPDIAVEKEEPQKDIVYFLIDSKVKRQTNKLIKYHEEQCKKNPNLQEEVNKQTNTAIDAFINHSPFLYSEIQHLSILQHHFLPRLHVLPSALTNYKNIFGEMLCIKLCGAGGGGFALGFTSIHYHKEVMNKLDQLGVKTIQISH